nr:MAG TPA: hypothetical protein [Caudoviricetes sp.]
MPESFIVSLKSCLFNSLSLLSKSVELYSHLHYTLW